MVQAAIFFDTIQIGIVNGCTDPVACNYDSSASVDDGSCIYIIWLYEIHLLITMMQMHVLMMEAVPIL